MAADVFERLPPRAAVAGGIGLADHDAGGINRGTVTGTTAERSEVLHIAVLPEKRVAGGGRTRHPGHLAAVIDAAGGGDATTGQRAEVGKGAVLPHHGAHAVICGAVSDDDVRAVDGVGRAHAVEGSIRP